MMTQQLILWPFLGGLLCLGAALYLMLDMSHRHRGNASMIELSRAIRLASKEFFKRETMVAGLFILVVFSLISLVHTWRPQSHIDWTVGAALLMGALISAVAGALGQAAALHANSRTAEAARLGGISNALSVAISGGAVMGLCVAGFSLIGLSAVLVIFKQNFLYVYAYALGVSLVSMFARLSGGIFTKGADIGADIITRSEPGFNENDTRNAAIIADNVGDNVGNVVGLGSNLMESFLEAIVAAMAIALTLHAKAGSLTGGLVMLPLIIGVVGALASILGIFFIRHFVRSDPQNGLTLAVLLTASFTLLVSWFLVDWLAVDYGEDPQHNNYTRQGVFLALALGMFSGLLFGFVSEYYTSFHFRPTRAISERSQFGAPLAVLEGLGVGMRSAGLLTLTLALTVVLAWRQAGVYGITLAAFGLLAIVGLIVTLFALGPIVDNAGGIAEMVRMDRSVRDIMESLHAVSNRVTAMGKGFANSSANFVALGLLLAFIKYSALKPAAMALDQPTVLAGLLLGATFPFYLSAYLLHAVGTVAAAVADEVRRQIREIPGLREGKTRPDTARCIELATRRAVHGMIWPGLIVIAAPVAIGLFFGKAMLAGFLAGALVSSLALGFQMVNAGGAMDNAKKYIEEGYFGGKGSEAHKAALAGDMVGDAFKDTVGPGLAMMIKAMCVISLLILPLIK